MDAQKKKRPVMIIMKNSDQNDQSEARSDFYVKEMASVDGDVYGDRSGVLSWGYDADSDIWFVKRKSLKVEYYKHIYDFSSWTSVDLADLAQAPFYNPSLNNVAHNFKIFLSNQHRKGFKDMKTAKSWIKSGARDPTTKKRVRRVMWPKTDQVKQVPVKKALPDGSLNTLQFWAFDAKTATVKIMTLHSCISLYDPKDLFMFREQDIRRLAATKILHDKSMFDPAFKQFQQMADDIVAQELWAEKLAQSEAHVLFRE
jgi:hypothetical protein